MRRLFLTMLAMGAVYAGAVRIPPFEDWRSTETCTADTNVLVATGTVYVKDITVASGSLATANFTYYNSSTTDFAISRSTSLTYIVNDTGDVFPLDEQLSDGFLYTKTGTPCIRVRWNWTLGVLPGLTATGYK